MLLSLIDEHAGAICLAVLLGFAGVAFFPFDPAPNNAVGWLEGADGLWFRRGSVLGPRGGGTDPTRPCSVEIWARPARTSDGILVAFFDRHLPNALTIEQASDRSLRIRQENETTIRELWVGHRFAPDRATLISVVSDDGETRVYFDAVLADVSPEIRATMADCTGEFVLGSGAASDSTWDGDMLGLALYAATLDAATVVRHYEAWSAGQSRNLPSRQGTDPAEIAPAALYVFAERSGRTVRDEAGGGRDLRIPDSFEVPLSSFLAWPRWVDIRMNGLDWRDIVVNVAGFTPFGLFFCAYLRSGRRMALGHSVPAAVLGGLAVSMAIEIVQAGLPTRTSSMTDVMTNIAGAAIGALLYVVLVHWSAASQARG